jgi:hypothetical protein
MATAPAVFGPARRLSPLRHMSQRLVVSIAATAVLALACAPRSRATTPADAEQRTATPAAEGQLATTLLPERRGTDAVFQLTVENTSAKLVELRFPSGHTHDFVVLDAAEREVWRWSEGRMFTQTLQTKQLKRGDVMAYDATWSDAPAGRYTVVATVISETHPVEVRREITLQ